jgi:hypothetical protein
MHSPVTLTVAYLRQPHVELKYNLLNLFCPLPPPVPPSRTAQQTELDMSASFGFLEHQDPALEPVTPQMCMIVASWLSEVAYEFTMQQETLFLAVSLLDRFLDSSTVSCCGLVCTCAGQRGCCAVRSA